MSRVLVEYRDFQGSFQSIEKDLLARLPLRNLHWTSSTRPVRSIPLLQVQLQAENDDGLADRATGYNVASRSGEAKDSTTKERRHQIPGLRASPYLKLFVLDCDDLEIYRNIVRKDIKEWIKDCQGSEGSSVSSKKVDHHDACEWLIIYLDTKLEEARPSNSQSNPHLVTGEGEKTKRPLAARLTSRSTKSVVEKLQKDFNESHKAALDRVAHIHVRERKHANFETRQLSGAGADWDGLIAKIKALILASFDRRVQQFEDDIEEREQQRSLPGWNFNTYFLLKEGLARGFESVGLREDALEIYRELSTTFESVLIDDITTESDSDQRSTRFKSHTHEFRELYANAMQSFDKDEPPVEIKDSLELLQIGPSFIDPDRKPFRDLILTNDITLFDFRSYIFARETVLLLASTIGASPETVMSHDDNDISAGHYGDSDLAALVQVAQISQEFISIGAATIREELQSFSEAPEWQVRKNRVIDNIISSWTVNACLTVLDLTAIPLLKKAELELWSRVRDSQPKVAEKTSPEKSAFPSRSSSLRTKLIDSIDGSKIIPVVKQVLSRGAKRSSEKQAMAVVGPLAALRSSLFLIIRRSMSEPATSMNRRFYGYSDSARKDYAVVESHSLNTQDRDVSGKTPSTSTYGISCKLLKDAIMSDAQYLATFEHLTASALMSSAISDQKRSFAMMTADLAFLAFDRQDFATSAALSQILLSVYDASVWHNMCGNMLALFLKSSEHSEDLENKLRISISLMVKLGRSGIDVSREGYNLSSLLAESRAFTNPLPLPFSLFFSDVSIRNRVLHQETDDGYQVPLEIRSFFREPVDVDFIEAVLFGPLDYRLVLTQKNVRVEPGLNVLHLAGRNTMLGWYRLTALTIDKVKIRFQQHWPDAQLAASGTSIPPSDHARGPHELFLWPHQKQFDLEITPCQSIDLSSSALPGRRAEVGLRPGDQKIIESRLMLRNTTSGKPLDMQAVTIVGAAHSTQASIHAEEVTVGFLEKQEPIRLTLPISMANDRPLQLFAEAIYRLTERPDEEYRRAIYRQVSFPQPLEAKVEHQMFKYDASYLTVIISTKSGPVLMTRLDVQESEDFHIRTPSSGPQETLILPEQSSGATFELRLTSDKASCHERKPVIRLQIEYISVDEILFHAIKADFVRRLEFSNWHPYCRVLVPRMCEVFRGMISGQDLSSIAIFRIADFSDFDDQILNGVSEGLPTKDQVQLQTWLRQWVLSMRSISLDEITSRPDPHRIRLPIDIASLDVLHTVQFRPRGGSKRPISDLSPLKVGYAVPLDLVVQSTQRWSHSASEVKLGLGQGTNQEHAMDSGPHLHFRYNIEANPADWIAGGQCTSTFSIHGDTDFSFPLYLIPQRKGRLQLPTVVIETTDSSSLQGTRSGTTESLVSHRTDNLNRAEILEVQTNL